MSNTGTPLIAYNFAAESAANTALPGPEVTYARDPTTLDLSGPTGSYSIGQMWWSTASNTLFILQSTTGGIANWVASSVSVPVPVSEGGTGRTSFTPYAVVTGGTSSTSPLQTVVGLGTATQVLTSNGAGALPSWQDAGAGSGGALSLIATHTAAGSTSLAFTSIPNTFLNYEVKAYISSAAFSGGVESFVCQLSTNNGATYISAGYLGTQIGLICINAGGTQAAIFTLNLYNLTTGTNAILSFTNGFGSVTEGSDAVGDGYTAGGAVNAIKFLLPSGGAFTGTFSLYGYSF